MSESVLEGEDLELFARSLRAATEQHTGDALDAAVAELGWDDALSYDTRAAVSTLFEAQGEACARSSALDRVVAYALGRELDGDTAVVLPPIGSVDAPSTGGTVRGLATLSPLVVPARRVDRRRAARSRRARCTASTPTSGWSRSPARSTLDDADAGRLAAPRCSSPRSHSRTS